MHIKVVWSYSSPPTPSLKQVNWLNFSVKFDPSISTAITNNQAKKRMISDLFRVRNNQKKHAFGLLGAPNSGELRGISGNFGELSFFQLFA